MSQPEQFNPHDLVVAEFADSQSVKNHPPASIPLSQGAKSTQKRSRASKLFLFAFLPLAIVMIGFRGYWYFEDMWREREQKLTREMQMLRTRAELRNPAPVNRPVYVPPHVQQQESVKDILKSVDKGIVLIKIKDSKGKELGLGTGFIINKRGQIATNFHVIDDAWEAEAKFRDEKTYKIKGCVAWDPYSDLAILEMENPPKEFDVLELAVSPPNQTEKVIAIGHPKGLSFSTTIGNVSAVRTTRQLPPQYRQFLESPDDTVWIQTTAPITHGNSGGPLLNMEGEVVGVNTWIDRSERIGFSASAEHLAELEKNAKKQPISLEVLTGPMEEVKKVYGDFENRQEWFERQLTTVKSKKEYDELLEKSNPIGDTIPRLLEIAKEHRNTPSAVRALRLVVTISYQQTCPDSCNANLLEALQMARRECHTDHEQYRLLQSLIMCRFPAATEFLKNTMANDRSDASRALACFCLGMNSLYNAHGDEKRNIEAATYLEKVSTDFSHIHIPGHEQIGEQSKSLAYRIRYLMPGCQAPEIVGTDKNDAELKLSSTKGKVTVVFFWADWCPYSKQLYPAMRKLKEKYKNQPFEIFGVNADPSGKLNYVLQRPDTVNWQNCCDKSDGPICQQWQITGFPTIYIIDEKGIIRHTSMSSEELEDAVEVLVAKATGEKPKLKSTEGFSLKKLFGFEKGEAKKESSSPKSESQEEEPNPFDIPAEGSSDNPFETDEEKSNRSKAEKPDTSPNPFDAPSESAPQKSEKPAPKSADPFDGDQSN